jgi:hypothetical protein
LDPLELLTLNPRFQKAVAQGRLAVPPGYRLVLPRAQEASFRDAYATLRPRHERVAHSRVMRTAPEIENGTP